MKLQGKEIATMGKKIVELKYNTDLSVVYTLHASEEAYKAKVYHGNLRSVVRKFFYDDEKLSLEKLEAIAKIIDLDTNKLKGE